MSAWAALQHRTVGFDLDQTLVDTTAATRLALHAIDPAIVDRVDLVRCQTSREGLMEELGRHLPAGDLPAALRRYARTMAGEGLRRVTPLPGALDAVAAVHAAGGEVVVVTGRRTAAARTFLDTCGLAADAVHGGVSGLAKSPLLKWHGAGVYVGDHPLDMGAAVAADAVGIGVGTGGFSAAQLTQAGAAMVASTLAQLRDMPATTSR